MPLPYCPRICLDVEKVYVPVWLDGGEVLRGQSARKAGLVICQSTAHPNKKMMKPHAAIQELCLNYYPLQDQGRQFLAVFEAAFDVHTADLRNVILKIVSEGRVEVGIDSALFKVFDCVLLMRIQLEEPANWVVRGQGQVR